MKTWLICPFWTGGSRFDSWSPGCPPHPGVPTKLHYMALHWPTPPRCPNQSTTNEMNFKCQPRPLNFLKEITKRILVGVQAAHPGTRYRFSGTRYTRYRYTRYRCSNKSSTNKMVVTSFKYSLCWILISDPFSILTVRWHTQSCLYNFKTRTGLIRGLTIFIWWSFTSQIGLDTPQLILVTQSVECPLKFSISFKRLFKQGILNHPLPVQMTCCNHWICFFLSSSDVVLEFDTIPRSTLCGSYLNTYSSNYFLLF